MILSLNGIIAGKGGLPLLLDTYSGSIGAYSLRKLRTAYTGSAIRVRRSSDSASQDIGFTANGGLDTASVLSFIGDGTAFVSIIYDQSGNGNHATQTTASSQPLLAVSGIIYTLNGKPIIRTTLPEFGGAQIYFNTPISNLQPRPISIVQAGIIYRLASNIYGNVTCTLGGSNSGGLAGGRYSFGVGTSNFSVYRQNTDGSATSVNNGVYNNNGYIQQGHFDSTTITNRFNGNDVTTSVTDTNQYNLTSNFTLMGGNVSSTLFFGNVGLFENIFYLNNQTPNRVGIESNINSYYSIY